MNLPLSLSSLEEVIPVALLLLFIFFLYLERKSRKALSKREAELKQKLYQISILKEIQDKISYSLNEEEVIDIITGSLKNLFSYSTVSSIIVEENKLTYKSYLEERVNKTFVEEVKKSMLASLSALLPNIPDGIEERFSGQIFDEGNLSSVASFFHIPFIVNDKVVGLINISSTKPNLYEENSVTILYQIVENASNALTRLREVLDAEEGKLTSMIASLADGVFMVDNKNQLLIINPTAKKLLNISKDDPSFIDILNAMAGKYDLLEKLNQCLSLKQTIEEKEIIFGENTYQIFITPVFSSKEKNSQKVISASILIHDITVEKNLSKIKEDFTNIMVHELRSPLTAIKDSSELMLEDEKLKDIERKQLLSIIDSQAKMLIDQISSILDAAKIEAGRFTIKKASSDLNEIINEAVEAFVPRAIKKNITINSYVPKTLPVFNFDSIRISQVLNNLISNSLKFTPNGGKITIFGEINENSVTISVSDTGMGISEEDQKDLFSKFYQIRKTPHELEKKGTGLGLYIVKGVVEAHGGFVSVKSDISQGTTISFTLPLSDDILHEKQSFSTLHSHISVVN